MIKSEKILSIYTDGSCSGNPGPGAYAYIVVDHNKQIVRKYSRAFKETTNNRVELMPVIAVLQWLQIDPIQVDTISSYEKIKIISDSEYLILGLRRMYKWKSNDWCTNAGKKIANLDLWQKIDRLVPYFINAEFEQIKGHSGDEYNGMVDRIAVNTRKNGEAEVDEGYIISI